MYSRVIGSLLLVLLAFHVGCGPSATKLLGTWRMEGAEQLQQLMGATQRPSGMAGALLDSALAAMAEKVDASMEVEFKANGDLTTRAVLAGNKTEKTGNWKLVSVEGDVYRLWVQIAEEDPTEIEVTMVGQDTIEMVPPNIAVLNRKFTFQRVQP